MDTKAEKIALFRYALVAPLVLEPLPRGELTRRAEEIATRHYDMPDSKRRAIAVDTLLEWAKRYRTGGFEALAPKPRQDRGQSRAIAPQLADLIERLKHENPILFWWFVGLNLNELGGMSQCSPRIEIVCWRGCGPRLPG